MWCPSCHAPIPHGLLTCPACGSVPVDRAPVHLARRSPPSHPIVAPAGSVGCTVCGDAVPRGETVCVGCGEPLA